MKHLKKLSNDELMKETVNAGRAAQEWTRKLLEYLCEVYDRRLHLERGHGSLRDFCIVELGDEERTAAIRDSAVRTMLEDRVAREAVADGELDQSKVSRVGSFIRREEAIRASQGDKLSNEERRELWNVAREGSSSDLDRKMAETTVAPDPKKREKERLLKDGKKMVTFEVDEETGEMLEKIKSLMSHKNPDLSTSKMIAALAEFYLSKKDPERDVRQVRRTEARHSSEPEVRRSSKNRLLTLKSYSRKRAPNAAERRAVYKKAKGKCEYVDPKTKRRCNSTYRTQIDHIVPFAKGGETKTSNLRVLCQRHNLYEAKKQGLAKKE